MPTFEVQHPDGRTALDAARSKGARLVRASVAECDREKARLLLSAGFRREAILAGQFAAGNDCFDLEIYVLHLTRPCSQPTITRVE